MLQIFICTNTIFLNMDADQTSHIYRQKLHQRPYPSKWITMNKEGKEIRERYANMTDQERQKKTKETKRSISSETVKSKQMHTGYGKRMECQYD